MRLRLTDRFIAGSKAGSYFDITTPGLELRVSDTGRKVWWFHFVSPRDGKRARNKLGTYPATSLAVGRRKTLEARGHVEEGRDPRAMAAAEEAGAMTVRGLVISYLEKHARPNLRSARALELRLKKDVLPIIGAVKLADLHRRDINRVVDPVLQRGRPVAAMRAFEDIRAVLRWAMWRGDIDANPMDGMKKPQAPAPRERVLSDDEIRTLWNGLSKNLTRSKNCQRIIRLCLVTAQRVGEVAGMRLAEIDLAHRVWTLPGSRTKNGHPHAVPLSDLALELIDEALTDANGSAFVFPSRGEKPLRPVIVANTIARAQGRVGIEHWTAHDLRRTAVTGMARLGVAPIVLGHVINHRSVTRAGVTLSVYSHYDYAAERRAALDLWADRLIGIIADGAEVVPIRGARR